MRISLVPDRPTWPCGMAAHSCCSSSSALRGTHTGWALQFCGAEVPDTHGWWQDLTVLASHACCQEKQTNYHQ